MQVSPRRKRQYVWIGKVEVELRLRIRARWKMPRYEVFLGGAPSSSGMVWRNGRKWESTGRTTFSSRKAALTSLVKVSLLTSKEGTRRSSSTKRANRDVTVRSLIATRAPSEQTNSPAYPSCPECGVSVRADRLARHLRRVHTSQNTQQDASPTPSCNVARPRPRLIPCAICGVQMRASRIEGHVRKLHLLKNGRLTPEVRRPKIIAVSASGVYSPRLPVFADNRWSLRPAWQGGLAESNRRRH